MIQRADKNIIGESADNGLNRSNDCSDGMPGKSYLFLTVVMVVFCIGCGSRSMNRNIESAQEQVVLADSILLYFQLEQFDKIVRHFDDNVKRQLNKEQLAVVWAQLNTQFGKYSKSEFYGAEKLDAVGDKVVYKSNFGSQKLYFELIFGKDNKIVSIYFKPRI
ncbi:MAG: DUF3887 domain-containing protein [Bacteroidales bacterium]|jgi:hypothetical protein|nr:DUF3887 domain-containing protein [Bacteroidales bacterium]